MIDYVPVAVVTGSSSGIGQAIAWEFARAGYCVYAHGFKNESGLTETLSQLVAIYKCADESLAEYLSCTGSLADLSSDVGLDLFFQKASQWRSRIDVWVNAAGADVLTGTPSRWGFAKKLDRLWSVDVRATMLLSRLAFEYMKRQSAVGGARPSIINIAWDQAERGMAGDSGQFFGATKAAIAAFTRSLAMTTGPEVRVNCLAPGWIQTSWGQGAPESWQARAVGESALARWGSPMDIANAAVWLSSSQAEFINGQVIAINGGWKPNYES